MRQAESPIEALYAAFKPYRLPPKMDTCPHCELEADEARLRAKPLRELSWDDFGVYPHKAMSTFGDSKNFRHFLPRMVELWIEEPFARYDAETLVRLLDYGEWLEWPASEKKALCAVFEVWCEDLSRKRFSDPLDQSELDQILAEIESARSRALAAA